MAETSYICCACNRVPNSADWGRNGLVCYGACNSVAIYDPDYGEIGKVTETLHRHTDRVNVVRWLRKNNGTAETELLSASTDGTAIVWSADDITYKSEIINDGNPLTIADGVYLNGISKSSENPDLLLCTASTEGTFTLWRRDRGAAIRKIQTLAFGRRIPTEARLSFLPRSDIPLAAVALDDYTVRIYCEDAASEETKFVQCQVLHGHEDWIRCMDFASDATDDRFLASGSQDNTIRLWKIGPDEESVETEKRNESQRRINRFAQGDTKYAITLESILCGHEHWVYGVHWRPSVSKRSEKLATPLALLSCAMDKSMIVWEADLADGGVWRETIRVGEVGGNSLGFYGCKYAPNGLAIMAHSYQGSFHLWRYNEEERSCVPRTGPTGHFSGVVDLCWDPKGRFLMSASTDQTTRVHAPWRTKSGEIWHEIGRPQVHGYDLSCLAMLGPYTLASGAEEKVVRVFAAPTTFQKYLSTLASTDDWNGKTMEEASVPALGLTNKAVFEENSIGDKRYSDLDYSRPPTEEELIRHTLWPESQKLYGHGYEIFSIAARADGSCFATACKSASAEHSSIIIWSTVSWSQIQKISCHRLTVTQMAFSPDDSHLVTVSRDRRFALYRCDEEGRYEMVAASTKSNALHARIIWCCAWTGDSKYFATGSRDGRIGLWSTNSEKVENGRYEASLEIQDSSVTALAFATRAYSRNSYVLAIGFDSGHIDVRKISFTGDKAEWRVYARYDSSRAHHSTVRRLAFRPDENREPAETQIVQLASCAMDNTLKIHNLRSADLESL